MKTTKRSRWLGLGAAIVASALALSACTPADNSATPDELIWGKAVEVTNFDPQTSLSAADGEVLNLVYEPLVTIDDDLQPAPALAESWEQTSPTTYVFDIRPGVTFSNGRELTVDDVVGSLQRVIDPATASLSASFLPISNVEAVGDNQVKVDLSEPTASFLAALAATAAAIMPITELNDGSFDPTTDLLGTGPYVLDEHVAGESWDFTANPDYWGEEPKVAKLHLQVITDDTARIAALRDGSIDFTNFSTPDAGVLLGGVSGVDTFVQPATDYYRVDVNAISSIFEDPRLREALALAIGRDDLATTALGGTGEPAIAATPPGLPGACDASSLPFAEQDIERATELVTEANGGATPITILAATSDGGYGPIAQVLQQQLEAVGFDVSIETLENGVWLDRVFVADPADFDLSISWFAGYADPGMVLGYWNPVRTGFNKNWLPDDPALDAAITAANATLDGRDEKLQTVCEIIAQGANMIPLVTRSQTVAYRSDSIEPVFPKVEGYGDPFRLIAQFDTK